MEAYMAWRRHENVQIWNPDTKEWDHFCGCTIRSHYMLRRQPQPKLRAWKPEEVPVGALVRMNWTDKEYRWVLATFKNGKAFGGFYDDGIDPFALLSNFEHSIDGGKTWLPCGVVE